MGDDLGCDDLAGFVAKYDTEFDAFSQAERHRRPVNWLRSALAGASAATAILFGLCWFLRLCDGAHAGGGMLVSIAALALLPPRRRHSYSSLAEAEKHGLGGVLDYAAQANVQSVEQQLAEPDWAMLEALREVDALATAVPKTAPALCVTCGPGKPAHVAKLGDFCASTIQDAVRLGLSVANFPMPEARKRDLAERVTNAYVDAVRPSFAKVSKGYVQQLFEDTRPDGICPPTCSAQHEDGESHDERLGGPTGPFSREVHGGIHYDIPTGATGPVGATARPARGLHRFVLPCDGGGCGALVGGVRCGKPLCHGPHTNEPALIERPVPLPPRTRIG